MRYKLVKQLNATLTATEYPVSGYKSPFTRGRECVLMLVKTANFAAGNLTIETDNASDGSYSDVRAAADADGSTRQIELFNVTLGDNLRITLASHTAGTCDVVLLGDT